MSTGKRKIEQIIKLTLGNFLPKFLIGLKRILMVLIKDVRSQGGYTTKSVKGIPRGRLGQGS